VQQLFDDAHGGNLTQRRGDAKTRRFNHEISEPRENRILTQRIRRR
jgi:hypothetical protein